MKDTHVLGDFGLSAGTQGAPSLAAYMPFSGYNASKYRNDDGDKTSAPDINTFIMGVGGTVITNFKLLGANYGANVLICFASAKVDGNYVQTKNSLAFSDMYVQPVQLGWHWKKADLTIGYGLYIPTGKYELGGDNNTGLGMWTHEFSTGGTWYLDTRKTFNLSTIAFYGIHSKKRGTDLKVGDILTLEGGLAKSFVISAKSTTPWVLQVGPVYYAQFKITDDEIPVANQTFSGNKDHIYGLGIEADAVIPKTRTMLSARWLGEMGAKNRFQGNTFMITIAQSLISFDKKK
ncbi:MAG: transporter [Tannerella sp.]|jgi:hypothetical protein|nr:transporter [Tannerella sp.]